MLWESVLCAYFLGHGGVGLGRDGVVGVCVEGAGGVEEARCRCLRSGLNSCLACLHDLLCYSVHLFKHRHMGCIARLRVYMFFLAQLLALGGIHCVYICQF